MRRFKSGIMPLERTSPLIPGYRVRNGSGEDQGLLVEFLEQTYQEVCPDRSSVHLRQTVGQHLSSQTPLWWVEVDQSSSCHQSQSQPVACLWLGSAVDQLRGDRHTHIFLLYVAPEHRRQGIGSALMRQAEGWAKARGEYQIGLQVFQSNPLALAFYQGLGYEAQAHWMVKPLAFQPKS